MIGTFSSLDAVAVPLDRGDVDTDAIIPARFLKTVARTGLGAGLFFAWRYDGDGNEDGDFPLNRSPYRGAGILVTGENFGCGSSREHAVWALMDYGFRAVIAPSFADIFYGNALKNGLLPVPLAPGEVRTLIDGLREAPGSRIGIDLPRQTVTDAGGTVFRFPIDPFSKECLLKGRDEIALTLSLDAEISRYEREGRGKWPWLFDPRV